RSRRPSVPRGGESTRVERPCYKNPMSRRCGLVLVLAAMNAAAAPAPPPAAVPLPIAELSADLDGDGKPERLHLERDGILRVDGERRLFPERWDFQSARFRAVDVDPPLGAIVPALASAPPGLLPKPLGLFHFVAASTEPGAAAERRADLLGAPIELEDGDPA